MHISRDSIFTSSIRAFFVAFMVCLGVSVGFCIAMIGFSLLSSGDLSPKKSVATIMPDAQGNRDQLSESAPVILRIDVKGVIGEGNLTTAKINDLLMDSHSGLFHSDRVKGVLLVMSTPGGTVDDCWGIYNALKEFKAKYNIPIFAFVEGLNASAGYYISMACDKIYANPTSIIGSIGVLYGPFFNFSIGMDKLGIGSQTFTGGKGKDSLNPFRPWKEEEFSSIQEIVHVLYDQFVDVVTSNRPQIDREKLLESYGAKVFVAKEAQAIGMIDDANSTYNKTLTALATAAGIAEETRYQVLALHNPHSIFLDLARGQSPLFTGKVEHSLVLPSSEIPASIAGKWLYYYHPLAHTSP